MKYKLLTKEQIIISLDRLTRFNKTKNKYLRVYIDILNWTLIEPTLKKNELENKDFEELTDWVSEIFNNSVDEFIPDEHIELDESINNYIKSYENTVFINDNETQQLLNNNINYLKAIMLIPDDCSINLKWLKSLKNRLNPVINRENDLLKYPIEEIILVEGITEEILLPAFAREMGYDFYAKGIQVIAAGGKNQVVKKYYELIEDVKLPIFILLDKDAEENRRQIVPRLRSIDRVHLVSCGEFEDLLPKSLIVKTVNAHFKNFLSITESDLQGDISTAKILEDIFKTKGLHEFKKAEFAKIVRNKIDSKNDISDEIKEIIKEISLDTQTCS